MDETQIARFKSLSLIAGGLGIILLLTYWGGIPEMTLAFGLGVLALGGSLVVLAALIWWFYLSPLPANYRVHMDYGSSTQRQVSVILMGIAGMMFVVGAFWDEMWHRTYGLPFGEDFLWRPHLLMYAGLGLMSLFASGSLYLIISRGKGTLRQRFRAQPLMGLLALVGGFHIITTPLDLVWHELYGVDLTAWSLPHIILAVGFAATMIVVVAIQRSLIQRDSWSSLLGIGLRESFIVALLGVVTLICFQLLTSEWENLPPVGSELMGDVIFWQRPEWLYPVVILGCGTWLGTLALHVTRRVGIATLVGVVALLYRVTLISLFDNSVAQVQPTAYLLLLPPLVGLDIGYAVQVRRAGSAPGAIRSGISATVAMLVAGLPVIAQTMAYPVINGSILPGIVAASLVTAIFCAAAGAALAVGMAHFYPQQVAELAVTSRFAIWVPVGVLFASLIFIAFFIGTAVPPV